MKSLRLYWGLSGPISLVILTGLTSLWMIFLVTSGLRSTCNQASLILRKSSDAIARPVLNGNLVALNSALRSLKISEEDALVFEGSEKADQDIFGRVVVGKARIGFAYNCFTPIEHLGLRVGTVQTSIDIAGFASKKLINEAASIVFFWLLTILVILISSYRAIQVLGSVNDSLAHVNGIGPNKDIRILLSEAIDTVPRNAGTMIILESLTKIAASLAEMAELRLKAARAEDKAQLARQVGHDIRSPLSALRILMQRSKNLTQGEVDLLSACYNRVDQVAHNLLSSETSESAWDILRCIAEVVGEKKIQAENVNWTIETDLESLSVHANRSDLQRILSNIFNNALEAHATSVFVKLSSRGLIRISDNGSGISDHVLKNLQLGLCATTKGADHGNGLSHARRTLNGMGCTLVLGKSIWNGAEVQIDLNAVVVPGSEVLRSTERSFDSIVTNNQHLN